MLLLVVARVTDIDLFVFRKASWPASIIPCIEHNETAVNDLVDMVVPVLAGLDDLVWIEMLFILMHSLFRAVIPTCVHPLLAFRILPRSIYLGHDGLRNIVRVLDMDPISNFPEFPVVKDAIWEWKATFLQDILIIRLALFSFG